MSEDRSESKSVEFPDFVVNCISSNLTALPLRPHLFITEPSGGFHRRPHDAVPAAPSLQCCPCSAVPAAPCLQHRCCRAVCKVLLQPHSLITKLGDGLQISQRLCCKDYECTFQARLMNL